MPRKYLALALLTGALVSPAAHAWFFIFPIPNLAKPAPLNALVDALEKSDETKAVAYVSDDKTFGSKMWAWGYYSGHVTQAEADRIALSRCQESLAKAKAQTAGGNPLYDFGNKSCELHDFVNKTVSTRASEPQHTPTPSPAQTDSAPIGGTASKPETSAPVIPSAASQPVAPTSATTESPSAPAPALPAALPVSVPTTAGVSATPSNTSVSAPTSATSAQGVPQSPSSAESPTARRLRELSELRKQGLITESEYAEKRKAILSAM